MSGSIFHTDFLTEFNEYIYNDVLTIEHITSNELSKKFKDSDFFGFLLERDNHETKTKDRFFMPTQFLEKLPIKVVEKTKFSFKGEVLWFISKCESCKIPARKEWEFRKLADFFANYQHSNPKHQMISRLVLLASYIERINIRLVSEASFGKDSIVDILQLLNGSVANLYNATLAKLKFALKNDMVIINELGGLKPEEISNLQIYLTQAGAYKPTYQNNSRSTAGTKETMSLMNKSHIVFHNTPNYYMSKGQKYFEEMFTPAIMDRFPALLMKGYVAEDFTTRPYLKDVDQSVISDLKACISTINYYKQNPIIVPKFSIPDEFWGFVGKEKQRSLRSFKTIAKYIAEYSETENEFIEWCMIMKQCRHEYNHLIDKDTKLIEEEERL